jgi:hypothetical protein
MPEVPSKSERGILGGAIALALFGEDGIES